MINNPHKGKVFSEENIKIKKSLRNKLEGALYADGFLVCISTLVKNEEGDDCINHSFSIGRDFKTADIKIAIKEFANLANKTIKERENDKTKS